MRIKERRRSWCNTLDRRPEHIPPELDRNILMKIGQGLRQGHYETSGPMPPTMEDALRKLSGDRR